MTEALLFEGGRVFTGRRWVDAFLVEEGRVVAAGPANEVRRQAPTGVARRPLGGGLVVPGLADAHLHVSDLTRWRGGLQLGSADSIDALLRTLREWADRRPDGPLAGRGVDPERLRERRWPTIRDLDTAVPDRPVVLYHASGHAAIVNSAALRRAVGAPDPPLAAGPTIGRFPDGTPNGQLFEDALRLVAALGREASPVTEEGVAQTLRELAALGLTSIGPMSSTPEELGILRAIAVAGRLPLRLRAYALLAQLDELSPAELAPVGDGFSVVGVKTYLDGAFGPRTAHLIEPYADDPASRGIEIGDDASLLPQLAAAAERGLSLALHAIGDGAMDRAARLLGEWVGRRPSIRIEHAALTPPSVLSRFGAARPTLVVQPGFLWSDWWLRDRLGVDRSRWAYAFRTLADEGFPLAGSSDAPYDSPDPWRGIRAAVARRDPAGRSANPIASESLPVEEALGLYTSGARAALREGDIGTLEPGAPADFVLLDGPDLARLLHREGSPVRETWLGGRRTYSNDSGSGE